MALKATVHRLQLSVADMDRQHYADYPLSVAQHPSENDNRMLWRIAVFALQAHADLRFGRGVSSTDEPDLWRHHADGRIAQWIDLGQPDLRRLRRAGGAADQVLLYGYEARSFDIWWDKHKADLAAIRNLKVMHLSTESRAELEALAARQMQLQAQIDGDDLWLTGQDGASVHIQCHTRQGQA